ncbi:MAG: glycosyltransferase family 39 protein [Elusimicrobia bacterium]|nr:glycosyltransferase family 39 protein [Elusimicrobiota bacterium]
MLKFFKSNLFFFLLLATAVFSLYGKSINFDLTYHDDDSLILEKADFLSDFKNIPKLFLTSCYYSEDFQYYRPVLNLSFLLETSIFGLNTKVYHITNIILFILALYLMYIFLYKLKLNRTVLKVLILLISVHPILTSSAVWLPVRNDTLLSVFIFLSFICFIKYLEKNSTKNLLLYILFFTIALFTKETTLLMLFLYPVSVICFNYKLDKKEIYKNILIFVPILLIYFSLRTFSVQSVDIKYYFDNVFLCVDNIVTGVSTYLYNFFIPTHIPIMLYDINLAIGNIILDSFLLIFISILYYKKILNIKILFFSIFWFVTGLFSTFLLPDYVYLNHRLLISLPGILLISAYIIDKLITKDNKIIKYLLLLSIILFSYFFICSFNLQNKYRDKYEYWNNAYLSAPKYHGTNYWLAHLYMEQDIYSKAKDFLIKANEYGNNRYLSDLALIYYREGDMDKAEEFYNKSIEYGINKAQCYRNLSVIYLKRDDDINKAIEYAKLAVKQEPYDDKYKRYLLILENKSENVKKRNI